jgi:WS/DGAT/MGAT family acyltransferase
VAIERLTAEDLVMLWPDAIWPQDIGAVAVLDGGNLVDADGLFRLEAVRTAVAARLHLVPRLRQNLYVPNTRLGGPLWVDDPTFDVARHVGVLQLEPPGDEATLLESTERLRRRRLDRSRPLWEMWFLTGMSDGRVGLFVRAQHATADGIAGIATLGAFLDVSPDVGNLTPESWSPAPAPAEGDLLADARRRRLERRKRAWARLAHPVITGRRLLAAWPALREVVEGAVPSSSLDRRVGPDRTIALVRGRLDVVKEVAHAHGGKVNDVFLTVIAGGLRALLGSRGESVAGSLMRIYVPVSLRHGVYEGARGNSVAQMVVPVPIGAADPVERLRLITAETAKRKARYRPSVGGMPTRGIAAWAFVKLVDRQRVNVETADVPGPPVPLYFAGARLLEVFPLLPLIGRVTLGVGAISYAGQFNIGVVADRDAYPDLEVFARGARDELHRLEVALDPSAAA